MWELRWPRNVVGAGTSNARKRLRNIILPSSTRAGSLAYLPLVTGHPFPVADSNGRLWQGHCPTPHPIRLTNSFGYFSTA